MLVGVDGGTSGCQGFFLSCMQPESIPKKFLCYKRYKKFKNFLDKKAKCQPWIIKI